MSDICVCDACICNPQVLGVEGNEKSIYRIFLYGSESVSFLEKYILITILPQTVFFAGLSSPTSLNGDSRLNFSNLLASDFAYWLRSFV